MTTQQENVLQNLMLNGELISKYELDDYVLVYICRKNTLWITIDKDGREKFYMKGDRK